MRIAVFFVYLCFLLLGGNNHAYTALSVKGSGRAHLQHLPKNHHAESDDSERNSVISKDAFDDPEDEYLIGEGAEDEDPDKLSSGKSRLLARYYLAFLHLLASEHPDKCHKGLLPIPGHPSPRYITLRVLRI